MVAVRYVSINTVPSGSTGAVMRQISDERNALGDECWCMWGRGRAAQDEHEFNFGTKPEVYADALMTRIDGRAGFYSKPATRRLLRKLDEIRPDVVHLHNLHGYYINVEMLFGWLAEHDEVKVRWTLHDCWAFTGHCAHFTYVKCAQWQSQCACLETCQQLNTYPKTISKSSCRWNFEHKKACFTQLSPERMTLITPSHWLEGLVGKSFLSKYPVEVRHNLVDQTIFKPTMSDFRTAYGIGGRFMILGVASPWTERKGLTDFIKLSKELDSDYYAFVVVGLSKKQIKHITKSFIAERMDIESVNLNTYVTPSTPSNNIDASELSIDASNKTIVATLMPPATVVRMPKGGLFVLLTRTNSPTQLAALYTAADIYFNPTHEDNYPTVNLEAEACGTTVVSYDTGGCVETLRQPQSLVVDGLKEAIVTIASMRR